jgi:ubiquinone/menaquinone biosynthesis C-methylase UbiE
MTTNKKSSAQMDAMRQDWNERARQDAFLYIASWRKDWDEDSFFASGDQDYQDLVVPVLQRLALETPDKSMGEIGCGAGRMTRSFASHFRAVFAVDISEEMQARAKIFLSGFSNITWILSDGQSLSGLPSNSLDFVFSYLVLQHFPTPELVVGTIREMLRALKPGGAYLFQFNGSHRPTMNWKGRLTSCALDTLASLGLKRLSRFGADLAGIDPQMVGKTWRGVALSTAEVASMVRDAGSPSPAFLAEDTPFAWCYGQKQPEALLDHSWH